MPGVEAPSPQSPASSFATALLAEFIRLGVRDLVLSPGSRSQALGVAAARFEAAGLLRLHVRIDERSAGFLALGLAIESRTPVVIVTTSGTAVANLHPAVLEARALGRAARGAERGPARGAARDPRQPDHPADRASSRASPRTPGTCRRPTGAEGDLPRLGSPARCSRASPAPGT